MDVPLGEMHLHACPDGFSWDDLQIPAVTELIDRTYFGGWTDQLDVVLSAPGPPEPDVENLRFSAPDTLHWDESQNNLFYDVIRGDVSALTVTQGLVSLGTLACVAEDFQDFFTVDGATPAAGTTWFYLVRPNGIDGRYGTDSVGNLRTANDTDCLL